MSNETTLEHVWFYVPQRRLVIQDSEGYQEEIQWKFDEEGAEGFLESIMNVRETVPAEDICFVYNK